MHIRSTRSCASTITSTRSELNPLTVKSATFEEPDNGILSCENLDLGRPDWLRRVRRWRELAGDASGRPSSSLAVTSHSSAATPISSLGGS